uniref:Uncharacterized protein n=1 Tax=Amphimedon queenslandica TaxID=400682 RepID=A0A1X7SQB0_AMPQE
MLLHQGYYAKNPENFETPVVPEGEDESFKLQVVPEGEDESFKLHQRTIQADYQKKNPNVGVVYCLMELSFAMSRIDIIEKGYSGVNALFCEYPFMQEYDHLIAEMCRILQKNLPLWKKLQKPGKQVLMSYCYKLK